jgi:hypothetical protein
MEQNTHITATFIWTFDDMKARHEALTARPVVPSHKLSIFSWLTYGTLGLAIITWIIMGVDQEKFPSFTTIQNNLPLIGMYLFLIITLWATFTFFQKRNLKQGFLQSPDSNKRVVVTITSDEIIMKADGSSETRWSWTVLSEVRKTPKGFCFFQSPKTGFWIPIRAFQSTNDIEAVAELAKSLTPKFSITVI